MFESMVAVEFIYANDSLAGRNFNRPGSARVSRVGFGVSPKQAFLSAEFLIATAICEKFALARRHRPHARRVRSPELELRWFSQEFDDALQQSPRTSAVEAAVIEAQRNLRFRARDEFAFFFIPRWNFPAHAESQQQSLVW
jgi:hypothetical protein